MAPSVARESTLHRKLDSQLHWAPVRSIFWADGKWIMEIPVCCLVRIAAKCRLSVTFSFLSGTAELPAFRQGGVVSANRLACLWMRHSLRRGGAY